MDPASIEALTFDVFGTVVDWRSSIIREGEALGRAKNLGHATPQAGALDGATVGEMVAPRPVKGTLTLSTDVERIPAPGVTAHAK
jgi:hypothetical protein